MKPTQPLIRLATVVLLSLVGFQITACGETIVAPDFDQVVDADYFHWESNSLLNAYQKAGHTDPAWDNNARHALMVYAEESCIENKLDGAWEQIIATNCSAAIDAGCRDPMIRYLFIRFSMTRTISPKQVAQEYSTLAPEMKKSPYPATQKFYAFNRAILETAKAYGLGDSETAQAIARFEPDMRHEMRIVLKNKSTPPEAIFDVCYEALKPFDWQPDNYAEIYSEMEPLLFTNWGNNSISWQIKGHAYIQMAWHARGSGTANTVSKDTWKIFAQDLAIAQQALEHAWILNPNNSQIADDMIVLQLGQSRNREAMEKWFTKAMNLNTNDYFACSEKLYFLEPKWYGSILDMIYFGRSCATNLNWGGRVPLILVFAHEEAMAYQDRDHQDSYWDLPYVRSDIEMAYNRFFKIYPQADDIAAQHAMYDYRTKRWEEFTKEAPTIRPEDYYLFGGETNLKKLIKYARAMAQKSSDQNKSSAKEN